VKFSAAPLKNLNLLDSTNFLTTDSFGNLRLQKVKFPTSGGGGSNWNFALNNNYITPIALNKALLIATNDSFPTSRIINKTTAGAMQVTNGAIFQGNAAPTLLVTNRFKPASNVFIPIGVKVDAVDSSLAVGVVSNGGSLFSNVNLAGTGLRGIGAIGIRGIGKSQTLFGPSVGAYISSGISVPGRINLLGSGLVVEGLDGASGLIVKEGNSGFGIKYNGQAFSPIPNSTVDINGTFGQSAKIYTFTSPTNPAISVPDTSNIYVITTAGVSNVDFNLPLASNVPNREYTFYLSRIKSNFNFKLIPLGVAPQIFDFKIGSLISVPFTDTTNNDAKIKAVSTSYNGNFIWMITTQKMQ
jgi:hypothetical protein